jgi:hypothetical protein
MKIAGQRRGEAYPVGPGGGGGGVAATVPLSRQRFIDGDTTQAGLTGAAAAPFKTIAQFIASRGNPSVADATANYVGWLMPALNGYSENVSFPPYASTELRADSLSSSAASGTVLTGNLTWNNVAGAFAASGVAVVDVHNITVIGSFTVTDDAGAPNSDVSFGSDEVGGGGAVLTGGFDSSTTTLLEQVEFTNSVIPSPINAGSASNSASVSLANSACENVTARSINASDTTFNASAITVNSAGSAIFSNCQFTAGPALTCINGAHFDGPSWRSFVEAGGTRAPAGDAGTPVLVVGGYNGAPVEGADLTNANVVVSLNGAGTTTAGFAGSNSGNHYSSSGISAARAVTLLPEGARDGDTMLITKKDLAAFTLTINNGGTSPGIIGVIPASNRGSVLAQFNASTGDWVLAQCGSLAA